jgi:hypothetical protein
MRAELIEELKNKYPKILEKSYDYAFEDGWYNLLNVAFSLIQTHVERIEKEDEFRITQLKEKFAGLRIYNDGEDEYIDGVISAIESMSYYTCEVTGNVGFRCYKGGWVRTLCKEKMEELGYSPTKGSDD